MRFLQLVKFSALLPLLLPFPAFPDALLQPFHIFAFLTLVLIKLASFDRLEVCPFLPGKHRYLQPTFIAIPLLSQLALEPLTLAALSHSQEC